jgi:hypothetical protein
VTVLLTLIVDDVVVIDAAGVFCFFLLVVLLYWLDSAVESRLFPFEDGVVCYYCCAAVGYTPEDCGGGLRKAFIGEDYSVVDWFSCSVTIVSSNWEVAAD